MMKIISEIFIDKFFKLFSGHIVLIGKMIPDIDEVILSIKADLYFGNEKYLE